MWERADLHAPITHFVLTHRICIDLHFGGGGGETVQLGPSRKGWSSPLNLTLVWSGMDIFQRNMYIKGKLSSNFTL